MKLSRIVCASLICTASIALAETKTDITHEVIGYKDSAYGEQKGYVATKSSTGSKMDIDIVEIPQSVSVITNDFMESIDAQTIQNVTAYNASVNQPYGENGDSRTDYGRIRGIGRIYTSSYLDGLRLLYGGNAIPKYDAYALERVEILKGPASVLYGSSGPGGLLNLQSKKPTGSSEKEVGISYGSDNTYSIFTDINTQINEKTSARVVGKYKEGDNSLEKSTMDEYFLNPSLTYEISDDSTLDVLMSVASTRIKGAGMRFNGKKTKFNLHNSFADNATNLGNAFALRLGNIALAPTLTQNIINDANSVAALNLPSDLLIGLPNEEEISKKHQSIGTSFTKVVNNALTYKNNLRFMNQSGISNYSIPDLLKIAQTDLPAIAGGTGSLKNLSLTFNQVENDVKSLAFDNNIEYKYVGDTIENTVLAGFDIQHTDYTSLQKNAVSYTFDLANPTASQNQTINRNSGVSSHFTNKITQLGAYVANSMKINDSLILSTAVRKDKLKNAKTDHTNSGSQSSQDDNEVSTRFGLTYIFDNGLAPYVSYSTSFQANVGTDANGNTFKPSVGKQIEVGTKYKPKELDALFSLAAFKLEEKDILQDDPTNLNKSIQQGDAHVKGIEFEVKANVTDNTNLVFSFAKLDGEEKNTLAQYEGKELADIPEYKAAIWAQHRINDTAIGNVSLGAGVKYIGKQTSVDRDYAAIDKFAATGSLPRAYKKVDDYTIVDVQLATEYKDWNIALNVKNLFDKVQAVAPNALSNDELEGRTFNITTKYQF